MSQYSRWPVLGGGGGGSGTVTSVSLAAPSIFTVTGSPVTTSGTLDFSLNTEAANTVFAGPATGADDVPTFRTLTPADLSIPPLSNVVYVAINGNDSTADGSIVLPYLTVEAAVNSVTGASVNNIYTVLVAPGSYTESPSFTFSDFVNIQGVNILNSDNSGIFKDETTVIEIDSGGLTYAPVDPFAIVNITGISFIDGSGDITINASTNNQVVGFNGCYLGCQLDLTTITLGISNGTISQPINANGSFILATNAVIEGTIELINEAGVQGTNSTFTSSISVNDSTGCSIQLQGGSYSIIDSSLGTSFIFVAGCPNFFGSLTAGGPGGEIDIDAISVPINLTVDPSVTYVLLTSATAVGYTPTTPSDWNTPAPTVLQDAVDRLAAAVKLLGGNP